LGNIFEAKSLSAYSSKYSPEVLNFIRGLTNNTGLTDLVIAVYAIGAVLAW
jgi:hypothetical protein